PLPEHHPVDLHQLAAHERERLQYWQTELNRAVTRHVFTETPSGWLAVIVVLIVTLPRLLALGVFRIIMSYFTHLTRVLIRQPATENRKVGGASLLDQAKAQVRKTVDIEVEPTLETLEPLDLLMNGKRPRTIDPIPVA